MREMADGDFVLLFDIGQVWALVVDTEREDSVLVWRRECGAVDGAVLGTSLGLQVQEVPWGKHGEFKLDLVFGHGFEWHPLVKFVLRQLNIKGLAMCQF